MSTTDTALALVRSDLLWLDDGNIVLQADTTLYKVHRSTLALHSPVFDDMFRLPQVFSDAKQEMIDGCPLVVLHDTAEDIDLMLRAFYGQMCVDFLRKHLSRCLQLSVSVCLNPNLQTTSVLRDRCYVSDTSILYTLSAKKPADDSESSSLLLGTIIWGPGETSRSASWVQ